MIHAFRIAVSEYRVVSLCACVKITRTNSKFKYFAEYRNTHIFKWYDTTCYKYVLDGVS